MRGLVIEAAEELAAAKRSFAEAFLLYRMSAKTDKQAEAQAEVECGERLVMAQARYELAVRGY